jgi:PAS domain S-box-containing protein
MGTHQIPGANLVRLFDLSTELLAIASTGMGRWTFVNAAMCRLLGWTAEDLVSMPCRDIIHPDDRHGAHHQSQFPLRLRCRNGQYRRIEWQSTSDPAEAALYLVGREIPETSGAQTEYQISRVTTHSEQQWRLYDTILSHIPDLVYVFDLNHRFTYANKALLTMWGKPWNEAIGRNCLELGYEPWHAAMHDREIEQVIATRETIRGQVPFTGTHGRRIYDYIFVPVQGADGEVEAIAGTTRDVTDQMRTEEELRRANRNLEQFAYSATHDLQEPLRAIKIYSELLVSNCYDKLEAAGLQHLKFLHAGATRMEALVRGLLVYTQASSLESPTEVVDAGQCLSAALANLAESIAESAAQIRVDDLPSLHVHATHLQQLFLNIVGNAVKYRRTSVKPEIQISAERRDETWLFSVRDNGIGIAHEYHDRIFGIFKRLHTSYEYSGTGIGLALCLRIVEHYHGRIWVESEPGKGSIFFFTLPA